MDIDVIAPVYDIGVGKIISLVGARPNFMKIAPFIRAIERHNAQVSEPDAKVKHLLVHTGQHYDQQMSQAAFFKVTFNPANRFKV